MVQRLFGHSRCSVCRCVKNPRQSFFLLRPPPTQPKTLRLVKYCYCIYISPSALRRSFLSLSARCFICESRRLNPPHKAWITNVSPQHYLCNGPWSSEISGGGVGDLLVLLWLLCPGRLKTDEPEPPSNSRQVGVGRTGCGRVVVALCTGLLLCLELRHRQDLHALPVWGKLRSLRLEFLLAPPSFAHQFLSAAVICS